MPNVGKIKQIIGAVVDVQFDGKLPEIYNALEIKRNKNFIVNWALIKSETKPYPSVPFL